MKYVYMHACMHAMWSLKVRCVPAATVHGACMQQHARLHGHSMRGHVHAWRHRWRACGTPACMDRLQHACMRSAVSKIPSTVLQGRHSPCGIHAWRCSTTHGLTCPWSEPPRSPSCVRLRACCCHAAPPHAQHLAGAAPCGCPCGRGR